MVDDAVDATLWLPIAEAARQMEPPVSRQALSKRVTAFEAAGQLKSKPGPRGTKLVNIVALQRLIKAETDPAQALRNGRPEPELPLADDGPPEKAAGKEEGSYSDSRARRETFQAENARLDLEERLGHLVPVVDVQRHTMAVMRKLRDRLLGIPALIAPEDAEFRAQADDKLRKLLDQIARELDELAEGDGEVDDDDDDNEPGAPE